MSRWALQETQVKETTHGLQSVVVLQLSSVVMTSTVSWEVALSQHNLLLASQESHN